MRTIHAIILGIGLALAALIFGLYFYAAKGTDDSVAVVGAATKRFDSDIVKWRITLSRQTGLADLNPGYGLIQKDLDALKAILIDKGLLAEEVSIQPINTNQTYGREGQITGYNLMQSVFVITPKLAAIEELALNPAVLSEKGMIIQYSNLEYFYSKLADIKMELLSLAAADARKRAEELSRNSGMTLGNVTSLKAGVFQITEPYSTEVSDYGMYNTQTKQKDITVTVRASFRLE